MLDFADGIESKNYGLRKTSDLLTLWDSLKILLPLAVIACALSFHIWVRSKSIQVGYQNQQLTSQEVDLLNDQRQLVLEEQTIIDPKALEIAALGELNMIIPAADRIIMPTPPQEQNMGNSEALALGNLAEASGTNVPSAFN